jgi:hypothetical protein
MHLNAEKLEGVEKKQQIFPSHATQALVTAASNSSHSSQMLFYMSRGKSTIIYECITITTPNSILKDFSFHLHHKTKPEAEHFPFPM